MVWIPNGIARLNIPARMAKAYMEETSFLSKLSSSKILRAAPIGDTIFLLFSIAGNITSIIPKVV